MLTIAGGVVLGGIGLAVLYVLVLLGLRASFHFRGITAGLKAGFKGFAEGLREPRDK
jgi:hypothetical protein